MKPLTYCMASLVMTGVLALPAVASAQAPLIYEGRLTTGDQPPDPWPGLRFSVVDADGAVWWSTLVEPDGPLIEAGPDGRFVAYLEDSVDNPWALAGFDQDRWLRVEVCPGAWPANPADDCPWLQLEQTQRLGTVPMAETVSQAERERIRAEVMADMWVVPDVPGGDVATLRVSQSGAEGTFRSVQEALATLDRKHIPRDVMVNVLIELAPVPYELDEPIKLNHEDGGRIHIVGETPPPGNLLDVILEVASETGLVVEPSSRLGLLDGVTLRASDGAVAMTGIYVDFSGHLTAGPDLIVEGFGEDCVRVRGVFMTTAPGMTVRGCVDDGFDVRHGVLDIEGAEAIDNRSYGIQVSWGATAFLENAVSSGNGEGGLFVGNHARASIRGIQLAGNAVEQVVQPNSYVQ